jgi:hypothetical protein
MIIIYISTLYIYKMQANFRPLGTGSLLPVGTVCPSSSAYDI